MREEIAVVHSRHASPFSFDGLLLCGGEDVDPELYGAVRHERLGCVNRRRDEQELALVARARRNTIPIFGICRGLQVLNVAFGGSLVQDIPSERPSPVSHSVKSPRDARAHGVRTEAGAFLEAFREFPVNSRHHQGIDRLGSGLRACAFSPEGLIEAVEAKDGSNVIFAVAAAGALSAQMTPEQLHEPQKLADGVWTMVTKGGSNAELVSFRRRRHRG